MKARLRNIVVTLGPYGVIAPHKGHNWRSGFASSYELYPAYGPNQAPVDIMNVTGAGDRYTDVYTLSHCAYSSSLTGGVIAGLLHGLTFGRAVQAGLIAAQKSLQVIETVNPSLTVVCVLAISLYTIFMHV